MIDRVDAVDAAMMKIRSNWRPASEADKADIHEKLDNKPPLTYEQIQIIAQVFRTSPYWQALRASRSGVSARS